MEHTKNMFGCERGRRRSGKIPCCPIERLGRSLTSNITVRKGNCQDPDRSVGFRLTIPNRRLGKSLSRSQFQAFEQNTALGSSVWGPDGALSCVSPKPCFGPRAVPWLFCHSVELRRPSWQATMFTNRRLAVFSSRHNLYVVGRMPKPSTALQGVSSVVEVKLK